MTTGSDGRPVTSFRECFVGLSPQLKSISVIQRPSQVVLVRRSLEETYLADDTGSVAALLQVLAQGRYTVA